MKKYILLLRGEDKFAAMSPAEMQATIQKYSAWAKKLKEEGRLVDADGLDGNGRIFIGGDVVTDGPFPEAKELIGGYYIFNAESLEKAEEIAKECPTLGYGGSVELRWVMDYS